MSKKVIVAEAHGFCFGVERAIKLAQETAKKYPKKTYILGEIVHNSRVVDDLKNNFGIKMVDSLDEIPSGGVVIIRSHGVSPRIYEEIKKRNLEFIDATCPMVMQVHEKVRKWAKENKQIIYIVSDINHDEAVGVYGEAPENIIMTTLKDINNLTVNNSNNTIVVTQTTLSVSETQEAFDFLKQKYPDLEMEPHICLATTERQKSVIKIAGESDKTIIVGSLASSNSRRLVETALGTGKKAYIVESAFDLKPEWFEGVEVVGVSSGASTPEDLLDEVIEKIKAI